MRVLFVCTGNICRSAFAERYGAGLAGDVIDFTSAGTGAMVGAPIDPGMVRELETRGCRTDRYEARQVTTQIISAADLILTMETHHRQWILDETPGAVKRTFTLGQAVTALSSAPTGSQALSFLANNRQRPRQRDNVADPYRRGPQAMSTAAGAIASALDALIPALRHP